ncbi:hypothetical protein Nepgr_005011 [Nepenthes gracilis]|uniref:RST domain-containing protein n=1 Tax=Nepenthes gracilis TaxID=150966 RepID=A0AAD3S2E3_NEPGR|nr:hypothetical protein Nepgr_005011 [Nepenthes gracilis]
MDPSIIRLLEEDEDETMHSGADVEAFTAALNRDIQGDTTASQPSDSDSAALLHRSNHQTSSQLDSQWLTSSHDQNDSNQSQQVLKFKENQVQLPSEAELKQHGSSGESQQQEVDVPQALSELALQNKQTEYDGQEQKAEESSVELPQSSGLQVSENRVNQIPEPDIMQNSSCGSQFSNMQNFNRQQTTVQQLPQSSGMQICENRASQIQEPDRTQNFSSESQFSNKQNFNGQQTTVQEQASSSINRARQIPFGSLLPIILPELDKDRAMQLNALYTKLRKNEIPKEGFVRLMRNIVGDQTLRLAVVKMHAKGARASHMGPNRLQSQNAMQQQLHMKLPPSSAAQIPDPYELAHLRQEGQSTPMEPSQSHSAIMQAAKDSGHQAIDSNASKSRGMEHMSDSCGIRVGQIPDHSVKPIQGLTKYSSNICTSRRLLFPCVELMREVQLHIATDVKMQQDSVPWQPSASKEHTIGPNLKREQVDQANDQQLKSPYPASQGSTSFGLLQHEQGNAASGTLNDELSERQSFRMSFSASTSSQLSSAAAVVVAGTTAKATPKRPSPGLKLLLEAPGSSPPLPAKKQKISGAFLDQSIEHLNDVTAVSGVNLREEEEQLFCGPKDDSQVSEASRRVVQEEEEKLILQKIPLRKKLAKIMTKCGLKNLSNDVEQCLSLCVEERLRGLISNLIRLSKQRVDYENSRLWTVITSDVRQQILAINQKAREEWEKKEAGAEKLQKLTDPDSDTGVDDDKEKDESHAKSIKKLNKGEDDKMRTTAANVAARAAVGGDDMLSKWQFMADQARQKREGRTDTASSSQPAKDVNLKPLATSIRNQMDNQGAEKRDNSASIAASGTIRRLGRNQVTLPQSMVARTISIKDILTVLEREPQMTKSTTLYRLYERVHGDSAAE